MKLKYGVGINDADYVTEIRKRYKDNEGKKRKLTVWRCKVFERWSNILYRCYAKKANITNPTYEGVTVCNEWLTFSNFKQWVESQPYENMELDKDILLFNNKEYCPEACRFVPKYVNRLLTLHGNARGLWPVGVSKKGLSPRQVNESERPFVTTISLNGVFTQLGRKKTPMEAHKVWQLAKAEAIDNVVEKWRFDSASNHCFRDDVAQALWSRSNILRRDAESGVETIKL